MELKKASGLLHPQTHLLQKIEQKTTVYMLYSTKPDGLKLNLSALKYISSKMIIIASCSPTLLYFVLFLLYMYGLVKFEGSFPYLKGLVSR